MDLTLSEGVRYYSILAGIYAIYCIIFAIFRCRYQYKNLSDSGKQEYSSQKAYEDFKFEVLVAPIETLCLLVEIAKTIAKLTKKVLLYLITGGNRPKDIRLQ